MCTSDSRQSMGWLLKAAHQNMTNAQYTLALEAFSGANFEKDQIKGFYWLRKAAQLNQAAQLQLAWILSTHPDAQVRNLAEAETSLAKVKEKNCIDKQTFYQTHAALAAEKGDFSKALKWAKKALKDAEKLKLPLTRIESHIASYQAKKPWREAI
jgi:uncharacterized protein